MRCSTSQADFCYYYDFYSVDLARKNQSMYKCNALRGVKVFLLIVWIEQNYVGFTFQRKTVITITLLPIIESIRKLFLWVFFDDSFIAEIDLSFLLNQTKIELYLDFSNWLLNTTQLHFHLVSKRMEECNHNPNLVCFNLSQKFNWFVQLIRWHKNTPLDA